MKLSVWLLPSILLCIWIVVIFIVTSIVIKVLKRLAKKTRNKLDDIVADSIHTPLVLILLAAGIKFWMGAVPLPAKASEYTQIIVIVFFIFGIILFLDKLLLNWINMYSKRVEFVKTSGNVLKTLFRIILLAIAGLIILDSLGISITPLVASLGVGGLAVALALQDTLSNFFSGIHILIDKPVKVGDYIKLESGEEGYVTQIGWRSTRVRMLSNNELILPNSKFANTLITNFCSPKPELSIYIDVGVSYDSDLEYVEKVTIDVGKNVLTEMTGGITEFEPLIRYKTFGDFSVNFTVILRVKEYVDKYLVTHEFIKRLHKRYKKEGIVIPFPITTVELKKD
ncbi:mechanosensitive ion channel family protein [candidate division WOR-3 bacterium]|nr:mechanosensitive ion channel family protein [candidate division WOR-3 bacterium]